MGPRGKKKLRQHVCVVLGSVLVNRCICLPEEVLDACCSYQVTVEAIDGDMNALVYQDSEPKSMP